MSRSLKFDTDKESVRVISPERKTSRCQKEFFVETLVRSMSMSSVGGDMDVCLWLTLKLNKDWSSVEVASLITKDRVIEIVKNFERLDSPIKVSQHPFHQ